MTPLQIESLTHEHQRSMCVCSRVCVCVAVVVYVYVYVCVHVCVQSCSHSHVLRRRRSDVSVFVGRETAVVKSSRITTKTIRKKRDQAPREQRGSSIQKVFV